jgi:transcriptional regulator with XRE-family HTH domain
MPRPAPFDALGTATPAQLLAFLKLLGVEQQHVADVLGLSPQLVSFWARGARPIPRKYREPLHTLAQDVYDHALAQHRQTTAALPTDALRQAATDAFHAPVLEWAEHVFYESGLAEHALRQALKRLRQYEDLDTWTAADLDEMARLCLVLEVSIQGWRERQAIHEARPEEASGA